MSVKGSSPLTRGKHITGALGVISGGLIPAHAGKTVGRGQRAQQGGAHPRSRGENVRPAARGVAYDGSSPLTRGKHVHVVASLKLRGLIPAHAGKTI